MAVSPVAVVLSPVLVLSAWSAAASAASAACLPETSAPGMSGVLGCYQTLLCPDVREDKVIQSVPMSWKIKY